ncbi:MAG: 4-aminobutyrate aminotransferase [Bacteroidetes bacterium GWE2_41_25]|nr:MAG: 4-aminobutyrate aminotransferase [Bacteroidetes bacterium GWA2_40_15]OFX93873.1 MAG: 4-aminobutyrate aminotransferase [Bacteroidetes bacterium GWE2_41_25]OFX99544.1 MAG: 4-aminobutyrate aminotransferase [Bacteroidetes bacterium GWC2_40_22]OFY56738.1 MAG: 4-aminobutyrate aminotransferase [Bacteroidetes bacterium GWF2_41_9]HAM10986.1 aspartate aminotransferase family protein [Bacteroidales bacterium]
MAKYSLEPVKVPPVNTKYRRIVTSLPVPESLPVFQQLTESEPVSMMGQPPVVWDKAEGFQVYDKWGNMWIDWSSGVLITNAGHGRKEIIEALQKVIDRKLLATYVFVHEKRAELTKMLQSLSPDPKSYQVFLLSTGSEATENCIKLAKTYALEKHGPKKKYLVSFTNAFHGRTMGAQLAGGNPRLKTWIVDEGKTFIQVPFPDGYKNENISFDLFTDTLKQQGINPGDIAGVMTESYQGVGPDFLPVEYAGKLETFCRENDIITIFDEVQSGFGRTGKMFCYEHYGIRPDLIACGKGISSSLPLSAVIGRKDIMSLYGPGSMTSTHSGSPLPVVAAVENLKIIIREKLVDNARKMGDIMIPELKRIRDKYPDILGCLQGKGLVAGIQVVKKGTKIPDSETAVKINEKCFQKGLLMFAPVGIAGECLKIAPPLVITEDALKESIAVFEEACDEILGKIYK